MLRASLSAGVSSPAQASPCENGPTMPDELIHHRLNSWTPSLTHLTERLSLAAAHDVTVLLTGETGTGKTFLARLIHECSPRSLSPFIIVPCGAVPSSLVESTFFGHVRGAFTGADRTAVGRFAAADGGTLLLDEVDALGLEEQVKLLRVLETGEYEPVGSNTTQRCTARIIATSNVDLDRLVREGRFRGDLLYRLQVMTFALPPLRERPHDIQSLVDGMVHRFAQKFRRTIHTVAPDALEALRAYPWPGNIRQLENALQQAVLVCLDGVIRRPHLPQPIQDHAVAPRPDGDGPSNTLLDGRDAEERTTIQNALASEGFSRSRTAGRLGVSRVTLYRKMKKYGLIAGK